MERLAAYSQPGPDGSVEFDFEGMTVDLVTICKAGGMDKEGFISFLQTTWDDVEVQIDTTNVKKDS